VYANIFWDILKQFGGDFFWKLPQQQLLVACMNHSTPCFEATEALQWPLFNFEKITLNSRIAMYSAHQHVNIINLCIDICMVLMSIYIYICICSYTVYIYIHGARERSPQHCQAPSVSGSCQPRCHAFAGTSDFSWHGGPCVPIWEWVKTYEFITWYLKW
jgi:hypothetical protein